jgi:HlyD family secretion protein
LEQSKRSRLRADTLFAHGSISTQEHELSVTSQGLAQARLDAALAQVTAHEAALEVARRNLDHADVRAPNDGVVITRNVDPGQSVASMLQAPVLFLLAADLKHMRVVAAVDEADIGEVAPGQPVTFGVTAYPDRAFTGTVTEVRNSPTIVQEVVSYGVVVTVDNADLALRPGMTASVRIRTAAVSDARRVPSAALHFTPPGMNRDPRVPTVFVLQGDGPMPQAVRTGVSDGELTALTSDGLPPDAQVLVDLTAEGRKAYGLTSPR